MSQFYQSKNGHNSEKKKCIVSFSYSLFSSSQNTVQQLGHINFVVFKVFQSGLV